jgi:hypothetical protein
MTLDQLPALDEPIQIGDIRFTRRQIQQKYRSEVDDTLVAEDLRFGRGCLQAHSSGVMIFVFSDSQMARIEVAAIIYNDCLPENHLLKKEHTPRDIGKYLAAARIWHFGLVEMPAYVNK